MALSSQNKNVSHVLPTIAFIVLICLRIVHRENTNTASASSAGHRNKSNSAAAVAAVAAAAAAAQVPPLQPMAAILEIPSGTSLSDVPASIISAAATKTSATSTQLSSLADGIAGGKTVVSVAAGAIAGITGTATTAAAAAVAGATLNASATVRSNKENSKPTAGDVYIKKPRTCTLLEGYKQNLKAAPNHFQRYADVKPREERAPTVMDLANQACVLQKVNGWKIFHLNSQMEDLVSVVCKTIDARQSLA